MYGVVNTSLTNIILQVNKHHIQRGKILHTHQYTNNNSNTASTFGLLGLSQTTSYTSLFTSDPPECNTRLNLKIGTILDMHPKILSHTVDPKHTYNEEHYNTTTKTYQTLSILKNLSSTKWSKHNKPLLSTYTYQNKSMTPLYGHLLHLHKKNNLCKTQRIQNLDTN